MNSERQALKIRYGKLYISVSEILFKADPIGINFEFNTDEYEPEVDTIIPRLFSGMSASDVQTIVYEEFCRWFDPDTAGTRDGYEAVSLEIWNLWRVFKD
jgi:hypothetical protein